MASGPGTATSSGDLLVATPNAGVGGTSGSVILATGSQPRSIPGYPIDGRFIVTSDEALDWDTQPMRVAIVGLRAQKQAVDEQIAIVKDETQRKSDLLDRGLTRRM